VLLQPAQLEKTKVRRKHLEARHPKLNIPMGVEWTDEFLMKVSEVTGKPIPESWNKGGRCMDLISDSQAWLHGKSSPCTATRTSCWAWSSSCWKWAPSRPTSCPTTATSAGQAVEKLLASPYGVNGKVYAARPVAHAQPVLHGQAGLPDRQHLRQVHPARHPHRAKVRSSLIRIGFPIFDRHHCIAPPPWATKG
jgi:nitrogenase molybdenum-iron protein beta chain